MENDRAARNAQRGMVIWVTLIAIALIPLAAPSATAAPNAAVRIEAVTSSQTADELEQASEPDPYRTAAIMGGATAIAAALAVVWWILIRRNRD